MTSMIDTLAISKKLQAAGDTPQHADALADVLGHALKESVATKRDLEEAVARLDHKIDEKFGILDHKITQHTLNLFMGISAVMLAIVGVATTIIVTHVK